jgi:TetR/AcrR family tetracycline transcriptional repressor
MMSATVAPSFAEYLVRTGYETPFEWIERESGMRYIVLSTTVQLHRTLFQWRYAEGMTEGGTAPETGAGAEGGSWPGSSAAPEPPWRKEPKSTRVPLTKEAIVEAALRVLDADGIDGLSMRRVGEELNVGAASIYWHVRNKDELLQLILERVIEEMRLPEPDPEHWQEQLRGYAFAVRDILNSHRDVARISMGRLPSGPQVALVMEWLFTLLTPAGIPARVIAYSGDMLALFVGAFAFEESLGPASFGGDITPEQFLEMMKDYLRSLPPDRFPYTSKMVDLIMSGGREDRFAFGVDLLLRGLESYARDSS